jgi:hypothetical protein
MTFNKYEKIYKYSHFVNEVVEADEVVDEQYINFSLICLYAQFINIDQILANDHGSHAKLVFVLDFV